MTTRKSSGGSDIFLSLLTVLFIGLKLTGYIAWPWYWVLSPIWIAFTVNFLVFVVIFVAVAIFDK